MNTVYKVVINSSKGTPSPKFFNTEEEARTYINKIRNWSGQGYSITKITTK